MSVALTIPTASDYRSRLRLAYDPSDYQRKIFEWIEFELGHAVVEAVAGSGKCLGRGTPVLRFDGTIVPVETIIAGDLLMGPDSQPRRVLRTNTGRGPLFKIIPRKGEPWVCNDVHVLTLAGTNRFKGQTIDIQLDEYHRRCAEGSSFRWSWKLFSTGVDFQSRNEPLPLDPYFLGLWIGDGTKTVVPGRGLVSVAISKPDPEVRACCEDIAAAWGVSVSEHVSGTCPTYRLGNSRGPGKPRSGSNPLLNVLRSVVGESITVPHEYLTASRADREALLAGWLDSDGWYGSGYYEIAQKRVDHADALEFLARSLGFRVTRTVKVVEGQPYQRLSILGDGSHLPLRIPRKQAKPRQQIKSVNVTGFQTEAIGDGEYFGFTLDGDGRFLLGDFTVTHNTTTIVSAAKLITESGLFVAFNKPIADNLGKLLVGTRMASSTVHSHGRLAIVDALPGRRVKVEANKYKNMVWDARDAVKKRGRICGYELSTEELDAITDSSFPANACLKLLDLARLSLLDMSAADFDDQLLELAYLHDIEFEPILTTMVCIVVHNCMLKGCDLGDRGPVDIDFTDMLWLPHVNGYQPRRYRWLFVDECQDISRASRALLLNSVEEGGRTLWVGDRRQSIYAFAGADAQSFQAIIDELSATVLPLSVCYRCPTGALDLARKYCPQIEARPGAPLGIVRSTDRETYISEAKQGDLVLCRRNAPLLALCFELIAAGVRANVRGKDIGSGLVAVVEKVCKTTAWADFRNGLDAWEEHQIETARKSSKDPDRLADAIDRINDKAQCVRILWARSKATRREELVASIGQLFSDDNGTPVMLSSIHKAKGLEAHRVVVLEPERLGVSRNPDSPLDQEPNIAYVCLTRTMLELVMLKEAA